MSWRQVYNGDFELGTLSGWNFIILPSPRFYFTVKAAAAHRGAYGARSDVMSGNNYIYMKQSFSPRPTKVAGGFWFRVVTATGGGTIGDVGIWNGSTPLVTVAITGTTGWTYARWPANSFSSDEFRVALHCNAGKTLQVDIDDIVADPQTPVVADFSGTPLSGLAPLAVQFTDLSTGSPYTWLWEFGDGTWGDTKNPLHTYADAGTYNVALTASRDDSSSTKTRLAYVVVSEPEPPAERFHPLWTLKIGES